MRVEVARIGMATAILAAFVISNGCEKNKLFGAGQDQPSPFGPRSPIIISGGSLTLSLSKSSGGAVWTLQGPGVYVSSKPINVTGIKFEKTDHNYNDPNKALSANSKITAIDGNGTLSDVVLTVGTVSSGHATLTVTIGKLDSGGDGEKFLKLDKFKMSKVKVHDGKSDTDLTTDTCTGKRGCKLNIGPPS
ncbi:MAG: hypothetical protein WA324_05000 [Bryobacteraceae bacterium]